MNLSQYSKRRLSRMFARKIIRIVVDPILGLQFRVVSKHHTARVLRAKARGAKHYVGG